MELSEFVAPIISILCCLLTFYLGKRSERLRVKRNVRDEFKRHIDIIFTVSSHCKCDFTYKELRKEIHWFKNIGAYGPKMQTLSCEEYTKFIDALENLDKLDLTNDPNDLFRDGAHEKAYKVYQQALEIYESMNKELC